MADNNYRDYDLDKKLAQASAISNNASRVLADIYFKGDGVKKDIQKSYNYALWGMGYNKELGKYYSKRYFGTTEYELFKKGRYDFEKQKRFDFSPNPFRLKTRYSNFQIFFDMKDLENIIKGFIKINKENKYHLSITTCFGQSITDNNKSWNILETLKNIFIHKFDLNTDYIIAEEDYNCYFFNQTYKIENLPSVTINIVEQTSE